ncbi:MAG: cyclase family protein [Anaerolineales bacterium]|nr:cyclase family protein [Anaerolineales bacterium]
MYIRISYSIGAESITLGSISPPLLKARSTMVTRPDGLYETEIRWNNYNNTSTIEMCTHVGTHIDLPLHVFPNGLAMEAYEISDFVFEQPLFITCPKQDNEDIFPKDLEPYSSQLASSDFLLLYTGFSRYRDPEYRQNDPSRYPKNQPGISPAAARYLTENFSLRGIGVDVMGIENFFKAKPDFPAHKILLGSKSIIMEDAKLSVLEGKRIKRVFVIPLLMPGAEAMPVTAFAEVE